MKQDEKSDIVKLKELLNDIRTGILITRSLDGQLDGRPMATADVDEDGALWFFTNEFSKKVKEISWEKKVFLTYSNNAKNTYVVIDGIASLSGDNEKMKQLWNPLMKVWFPEGLDDPAVSLLKVEPSRVEYWEANMSRPGVFMNRLKSIIKGKEHEQGKHDKMVL